MEAPKPNQILVTAGQEDASGAPDPLRKQGTLASCAATVVEADPALLTVHRRCQSGWLRQPAHRSTPSNEPVASCSRTPAGRGRGKGSCANKCPFSAAVVSAEK